MQLRIIAGDLKGRAFAAPRAYGTHPMGERIRGALFNVLGDIGGMSVFDPYAGSGALSFEALSRGAGSALLIEQDQAACRTIHESAEALGVTDKVQVITGNCVGWSNTYSDQQFDLVLCDPPYDAVLGKVIEKLSRHVSAKGLLVLSWPSHVELPELPSMAIRQQKTYGNATLAFYAKTA